MQLTVLLDGYLPQKSIAARQRFVVHLVYGIVCFFKQWPVLCAV